MLTSRYELKYPITADQKERFLQVAREGLIPDPHSVTAAYRVSSQYFDTDDLAAYWEKLDGEEIRQKYRLRYYSVAHSDKPHVLSAFMEIKHRANNTLFKERVRLTDEGAEAILSDSTELTRLRNHVAESAKDSPTVQHITRVALSRRLSAVHVITYLREGWMGENDNRLRVTVDTLCEVYPSHDYLDVESCRGRSILDPNNCLLEIKFNHAIPSWLREIVADQGLQLRRFSKYAAGVEANP